MRGLIGRKVGMTRLFDAESGQDVPITVIAAGENVVHAVRTVERDGYRAVQLGFDECGEKKVSKPVLGQFKKLNTPPCRVVKEFELDEGEQDPNPGQKVGVDVLDGAKYVDVTGVTKGRGFAGTIKRHSFQRGRETHGNTNHREPGSTGSNTYPSRVFPGKRMPGQYGNQQRTTRRLQLVGVEKETGLLFVRGAIPGKTSGVVIVRKHIA